MGNMRPCPNIERHGKQTDPLFVPPRIKERSFAEELIDLELTSDTTDAVLHLHEDHLAIEARHMASAAVGEILRAAAGIDQVCAVLARQLKVTDETLPQIAHRFSRTKQALHLWHKRIVREFALNAQPRAKVRLPFKDAIRLSDAPSACGLSRITLSRARRDGRLRVVSHSRILWVTRADLRRLRRAAWSGGLR